MRRGSDVTRVRVNYWVRVRLRSGDVVDGRVICHHDRIPSRHTIQSPDGTMRVVEFPDDTIIKLSAHPFTTPYDPAKLKPIVRPPEPAPQSTPIPIHAYAPPKRKPRARSWGIVAYVVTFIAGATLGAIGATLYHLNAVFW